MRASLPSCYTSRQYSQPPDLRKYTGTSVEKAESINVTPVSPKLFTWISPSRRAERERAERQRETRVECRHQIVKKKRRI